MKKRNIFYWVIFSIGLSVSACVFHVNSPKPNSDGVSTEYSTTPDNKAKIIITFSEAADTLTVNIHKTVILKFSKNANADAVLTWSSDNRILTIVTVDKIPDLGDFHPDDSFLLTLIGDDKGNGAIKSKTGKAFDGNFDNKTGDDYSVRFPMIG